MVVAHQRHKSTGDMLGLARNENEPIARNQTSQYNLIHIASYDDEDDQDQDERRQKRMPLLEAQQDTTCANRWTSCKTLECHDAGECADEDESFLSGKQQWVGSNQDERAKRPSRTKRESKSAGNFNLLFSLFQTQQQQQQPHECDSDREKTRARVDASQNKTSRSIGQKQADSNLASAASLPHLFVPAAAATATGANSICAADTTRAATTEAATRTSSRRRESWSRAGLAQRRRQLAAAASQGQPVMKLPRVEQRRLVRAKPELRARQMTASSCDNNAPQEHSSCRAPDSDGDCSAWLNGSESRGLESQPPPAARDAARLAHKSHASNNAGVGETCTTGQVSGAFGDSARCVAQPSASIGDQSDGRRKVMRNTASTSKLDNARLLASFQGAEELHNQTGREQQLAVDNRAPGADGQDARRCAPMASNGESSPTHCPLACQLASQSQARDFGGGTVSRDCTDHSAHRARARNAAQIMDATTKIRCDGDDDDESAHANQVSSGQDQVCRVQAKNVKSTTTSQETSNSSTTTSVASKLADTCASSWRMALMATSGVTSSAGSYKVAQRERLRECAPEQPQRPLKHQVAPDQRTVPLLLQHQQQQRACSRERNAHAYANNDNENIRPDTNGQYCRVGRLSACEEVAIDIEQQEHQQQRQLDNPTSGRRSKPTREASARGSQNGNTCHLQTATATATISSSHRLARPGRSPVSLQRQTNARLARHKLKIQQQRQEQLTRLALREREYLTSTRAASNHQSATTCLPSTSTSQTSDEFEIEVLAERGDQQTTGRDTHSSSLLRGLLERLSLASSSSSSRQVPSRFVPPVALVNFGPSASTRTRDQRQSSQRQQQVAIEICDNRGRPSNVITFSASSAGDDQQATGNRASPERRRELRDMQQQLTGGCGLDHQRRGDKIKTLETDSQFSSSSSSSSTSSSTLSLNKPFCKICHLSSTGNESDKLISPCKCSGTMQYIHCGCLLKWLEISNRTNEGAISCELCAHEYTWHKRFNYEQMKLPKCCSKDILLHLIFLAALGLMLFCALAPIFNKTTVKSSGDLQLGAASQGGEQHELARPNLRSNSFRSHFGNGGAGGGQFQPTGSARNVQNPSGKLASDEKFILLCAAFFFISFFVAIYSQMKTRDTLYGLIVKFANMNLTYYITEYDHGTNSDQHQIADKPAPADGKGLAARQDRYRQHHPGNNEQRHTEVGNGDGGGGDTRRKGSA